MKRTTFRRFAIVLSATAVLALAGCSGSIKELTNPTEKTIEGVDFIGIDEMGAVTGDAILTFELDSKGGLSRFQLSCDKWCVDGLEATLDGEKVDFTVEPAGENGSTRSEDVLQFPDIQLGAGTHTLTVNVPETEDGESWGYLLLGDRG